MADGLRIWNASGVLLLDATHHCARIKGAVYITGTPGSSGSQAADLSGGAPFYSFQPDQLYYHISNDTPPPIITISSTGISWQYSNGSNSGHTHIISGWCIFGVS